MLVVISPAKKLDMSIDDRAPATVPDFAADAAALAGVASCLTHDDLTGDPVDCNGPQDQQQKLIQEPHFHDVKIPRSEDL